MQPLRVGGMWGPKPLKFVTSRVDDLLTVDSLPELFAKDHEFEARVRSIPAKLQAILANYFIGIEIEIENMMPWEISGWERVQDNSLRDQGLEYKSPKGTRLGNIPKLMRYFNEGIGALRIKGGKGFGTFGERTSVHVHVDCRILTGQQIRSLLMLYTIFEDSFFEFAGPARKSNIFCVPLRYSDYPASYGTSEISQTVRNWTKYCALNLQALQLFGTAEFRHMAGNSDPIRIIDWVILLGLLRKAVTTYAPETIINDVSRLKFTSQYHDLARKIFFGYSNLLNLSPVDLDEAVSEAKLWIEA